MSIFHNTALAGASGAAGGGAGGYQIERSIRLNSADSAFLSRTPASAGNRKTWTWAGWVKRSGGNEPGIFSSWAGSNPSTTLYFNVDNRLVFYDYNSVYRINLLTTQVFRDFSAWYHIVVAVNTTAATSTDRVKIYVNGVQITAFDTATYPALDWETNWNSVKEHNIGKHVNYQEGYLADVHFIDGQALTPSSFTETSATTGQLIPKAYSGSFGTNGFWLKFSDNSAATAATLGKDYSGNSNNWTPNNLSVTAGAGNDSLVDTPTSYGTGNSGGDVRGNYATLNPLTAGSYVTLSNGNLQAKGNNASDNGNYRSSIAVTTGKWYIEVTCDAVSSSNNPRFGIILSTTAQSPTNGGGSSTVGYGTDTVAYERSGQVYRDGSLVFTASSYAAGDLIGIALDADNGAVYFAKNGVWQNSGDPTSGAAKTGALKTWTGGLKEYLLAGSEYNNSQSSWNFGQRQWAYAAPAGYKALCTTNLPAPTIALPSTVMDVKLYTGNGSTQTVSGLNFSPDWIWFKQRNTTRENHLYDSVRGVQKALYTDLTNAEATDTDALSSFNSDGWTMGADGGSNQNGGTYVAWCWDAGSSTTTNNSGSISSQVRANASAGFSIVTYTGNGTNPGATIGHGLGVSPGLIITKSRSGAGEWPSYHSALPVSNTVYLNATYASTTYVNRFSAVSSTTFTTGSSGSELNANGVTYVAYCFAPVAGYSSFGSYTGNGSADGPFVFCGFRPRWIMWKCTTAAYDWDVYDAVRDPYNAAAARLKPNSSDAEATLSPRTFDILSNGFKLREGYNSSNASSQTYIYAAFAESPFQFSRAR